MPDFIIIGAQKSASTFVQECLRQHPRIFMPYGETPWFESPEYESRAAGEFFDVFDNKENLCCGIKRPNYLGREEVPARIYKHIPDAKLIVVLRNPIERALSAYFHNMTYGVIPLVDIEQGFRKILDGEYDKKYKRAKDILNFGLYFRHLQNYLQFFKPEKILVILHDDVCLFPNETIKKVFSFLGVNSDFKAEIKGLRPQSVIYNLHRLSFVRTRNKFIYKYNDDFTRFWIREKNIAAKAVYYLITGIDCLFFSKMFDNTKPAFSENIKAELLKFYDADITELEAFLSRDLDEWRK